MTMNELIMKAREKKCSDIHISEGMPVSFRIHGQLLDSGFSFPAAETREMILSMLSDEQREQLENGNDVDFAIETPDYCRQRVNVFRQMKKVAATIRLLNNTIPTLEQLQMPKVLQNLADQPRATQIIEDMIAEGTLRDLTFEWGNMLAKVDLDHPFKEPDERLVQLFRDNYSMEKNGN